MAVSAVRKTDCAFVLVQDDPTLAAQVKADGFGVIYRQSGDDANGNPIMQDPGAFVAKRAQNAPTADFLHLTNELDVPTLALLSWTRAAMQYADRIGRKVCLFNFSTNRDASTWTVCEPLIREAVAHGHAIGLHAYFDTDPQHDAGAWSWQELKHRIGGLWIVTEFAYIRDIRDGGKGWRAALTEKGYSAFLANYVPRFVAENMPLCLFAFDDWPGNDAGRQNGFGVHDAPDVLQTMTALNARYPFKGVSAMPAPPIINVPLPSPLGSPVPSRTLFGLKLHAAPSLASPSTVIPAGAAVTVYSAPLTSADGYTFAFAEWAANRGYAAVDAGTNHAPSFDPAMLLPVPPVTWTVSLDVPYVSQFGTTAATSNNDCGIASLAMLERYRIAQMTGIVPTVPTVDDLEQYTPLNGNPALKGLTFAQIGDLAKRTGFRLQYTQPLSAEAITGFLRDGKPVMVLLDYSVYAPGKARIAHILVVSGYNATDFLTQDPYQLGSNVNVSQAQFMQAMAGSPGNGVGFQGAVLA